MAWLVFTVSRNSLSGSESFTQPPPDSTGANGVSVTAANVNGDGKLDLISANLNANTLTVLLNTPTFTGVFSGNGSGLTARAAGNLTGKLDDARLSTNVALRAGGNISSGDQFVNGALNVNSPGYGGVTSIIRARSGDNIPFAVQDFAGNNLLLVFTNANGQVNISGPAYAQFFNPTSDRNAKENFKPVDARAVRDKLAALPLTEWNYKADTGTRHIGPMAQDFHAAYGVGSRRQAHRHRGRGRRGAGGDPRV